MSNLSYVTLCHPERYTALCHPERSEGSGQKGDVQ